MACTDSTCVYLQHGVTIPVDPAAPGNYTLPNGNVLPLGVSAEWMNENRNGAAIAALLVIFVLCLPVSIARVFVRATTKAPGFGWDDGILAWTILLYIAFIGLAIPTINTGESRHIMWIVLQGHVDVSVVSHQEIYDFALHLIYNTAMFSCRLSALAFFLRLSTGQKTVRVMVYVWFGLMTALYLPQMFTLIFHCHPVTALWPYLFQLSSSRYTCLGWNLVYLINACLSVTSDLLLFAIPATLISAFKTDLATRIKLICILCPGALVICVSLGRLGLLGHGYGYWDQSWFYGPMLGLEGAEIGGTMVAISVPALKAFTDRILASVGGSESVRPLRKNEKSEMTFTATHATMTDAEDRGSNDEEKKPTYTISE